MGPPAFLLLPLGALLALLRRVCFRLGLRLALRLLSSLVFAEDELAVKDEVLELLRCLRRLAPFFFSPASAATCIAGALPAASGCDGAGDRKSVV